MLRRLILPTLAAAVALSPATLNAQLYGSRAPAAQRAAAPAADPAIRALVDRIAIPYERFTLPNGLTVITHTDRKAPVVAVSTWYNVGSRLEPAGSTGFAHLFEHIMFNGSENNPGDFFTGLQQIGATDTNGTTNADRTNYFQTVPTGALERALFMEADRMGNLLPAVTQATLDNQRGVVQNEKRQGDNNPFGLLRYYIFENLFPQGHPYYHSTIGSMDDLNSASLDRVRSWFRDNYGPNNAVLVLAGDIDAATARPMVERWFGGFPRGNTPMQPRIEIPTLPAPLAKEVTDQIANPRIFRMWTVPGSTSAEAPNLQLAASVLGGLGSSRLDSALVRGQQLATSVSAGYQGFRDVGLFIVSADLKPGADLAALNRELDKIVADFRRAGPTADELQRARMSALSGQLSGLESVGGFGGKATALAEGQLYSGDPSFFRTQLNRFVSATPAQVQAAMNQWTSRPVFSLTYKPGPRTDSGEGRGGATPSRVPSAEAALEAAFAPSYRVTPTSAQQRAMGQGLSGVMTGAFATTRDPRVALQTAPTPVGQPAATPAGPAPAPRPATPAAPVTTAPAAQAAAATTPARPATRLQPPALQPLRELDFPRIERATLANGIKVYFARRSTVPTVQLQVSFDAGAAADPKDRQGLQALTMAVMEEGTTSLDAEQLAMAQERLGAGISTSITADNSAFGLYALAPNLRPSLALLADVIRNPAFAPAEIERLRTRQLAGIAASLNSPAGLAQRALFPTLYGPTHPYGSVSAQGSVGSVRALTRDDMIAFQQRWLRPDNATIYAVGDVALADLVRDLNATLGNWQAPAVAKGVKDFSTAVPAPRQRILLIDRPNSPQSVITAAQVLDARGRDDLVPLQTANDVLGGNFLSRINMNLRESKGWSYGSRSSVGGQEERVLFTVSAPVQAVKTGDAIREIQSEVSRFVGTGGITADELDRTINGQVRELPGSFETSSDVLGGIISIVERGRPDDYYQRLPARYRSLTAGQLDTSLRGQVDPAKFVYIVVGNAATVRPQLEGLGMPIEVVDPATLGGR